VQYLIGCTQPVLAVRLQNVKEVVPLIQKMIMKIEQQAGPFLDAASSPFSLCSVGQLSADLDISRSRGRELAYHVPRDG
jgi:hypothetical protein